jgi:Tfp pilus assembly pilus retraction ATPase PilT
MARHLWIDEILTRADRADATEIRLKSGAPPMIYADRNFASLREDRLTEDDIGKYICSITPDDCQRDLARVGFTRFDFRFGDVCRCFVRIEKTADETDIRIRSIWRHGH